MAGGGAEVSVAAFNEMKNSMAQLVNLAQLQANSVARLEREADVSKLKAQRAKSDKDGKKAGIHTQMEILEEALYGLAECDRLVEQCVEGGGSAEKSFTPMKESSVESVHDKLKAVGTVLRRRLVALEIADGAATMQNGWRSVELWEEGEEASEGVAPSKDKKRKLYSDAAQSIEADNKRRKVPYAGGGWRNQSSEASQGSQTFPQNSVMRPGAASGGMAFSGGRPIPPHKGGTEPCVRCGKVGHWAKECPLLYGPGQG
jgi:hypothetical protein